MSDNKSRVSTLHTGYKQILDVNLLILLTHLFSSCAYALYKEMAAADAVRDNLRSSHKRGHKELQGGIFVGGR